MDSVLRIPENFYIGRYDITLKCKDTIMLSDFKGSTLRGALMSSYYKIACVQRSHNSCKGCLARESCSFSKLFKSTITDDSQKLSGLENIPRPFALYIPWSADNKYLPGENLNFRLILIGQANEYIGHIILALKRLEKEGIGRGRGKFRLKEITTFNGKQVYDSDKDQIYKEKAQLSGDDFNINTEQNKILLKYQTPCRLKYNNKYVKNIKFHHLIRNLCRRFSMLARAFNDIILDWNFDNIINQAEKIKLVNKEFEWEEKSRYSSTQDKVLVFGGIRGKARYEGNINYFIPLLKLGEWIQIGKNTTFGLGKYSF